MYKAKGSVVCGRKDGLGLVDMTYLELWDVKQMTSTTQLQVPVKQTTVRTTEVGAALQA